MIPLIVTIHQPNFLPWLGFFDKVARADLLIVLDNVAFERRGFQNRVRLKSPSGPRWLTAPVVSAGHYGERIDEVRLDGGLAWARRHLLTLETWYRGAPGYAEHAPLLGDLYAGRPERLVDFSVPAIARLAAALGVSTPTVRASDLGGEGRRSALLCDLAVRAGGTVYLSGPSGRDYLDESVFAARGVEVRYHDFRAFAYPQKFGAFQPALSALDYLLNEPSLRTWTARDAGVMAAPPPPRAALAGD